MPEFHRIEELPQRVGGETVVVRGWVMTTRSSGKIAFVALRDGTGYLQAVLSKKDVSAAAWDAFGKQKSTRLNSSHQIISYAVFCLKKKNHYQIQLLHRVVEDAIRLVVSSHA